MGEQCLVRNTGELTPPKVLAGVKFGNGHEKGDKLPCQSYFGRVCICARLHRRPLDGTTNYRMALGESGMS
jgi:hypothetical protein